jgi:hypothetical protein
MVVPVMPRIIAARTRQASSVPINSSPKRPSSVCGRVKSPSVTMVASLGTMTPILRRPISARNTPMPAPTAA